MKAFSTLVMVFLMSFTLFAQTDKNLVKTEKVGDLQKVTMFYESGELHQVGYIKNDKLHGGNLSIEKEIILPKQIMKTVIKLDNGCFGMMANFQS